MTGTRTLATPEAQNREADREATDPPDIHGRQMLGSCRRPGAKIF